MTKTYVNNNVLVILNGSEQVYKQVLYNNVVDNLYLYIQRGSSA